MAEHVNREHGSDMASVRAINEVSSTRQRNTLEIRTQFPGIDAESRVIDLDEMRNTASVHNCISAGDEGQCRDQYLFVTLNSGQLQAKLNCDRAVANGNRSGTPGALCECGLKASNVGPGIGDPC